VADYFLQHGGKLVPGPEAEPIRECGDIEEGIQFPEVLKGQRCGVLAAGTDRTRAMGLKTGFGQADSERVGSGASSGDFALEGVVDFDGFEDMALAEIGEAASEGFLVEGFAEG
jgi:hypothetical protein